MVATFDWEYKVKKSEKRINEINVLLTRGVNGLYNYTEDRELREALLSRVKNY